MSDAMSDLTGLVNAFSGFLGSVNQLHEVRVNAEAERVALQIGTSRFNFLKRFSLKMDDPNKLTAEEKSWRPAFEKMTSDTEAFISSIKDESVRRGVAARLTPQNQKFQLDLSATMTTAEKELAQQNKRVALAMAMDIGDDDEVRRLYKDAYDKQMFDPIEMDKIRQATVLQLDARGIAGALMAKGGTINDAITLLPSQGIESDELAGTAKAVLEAARAPYEADAKELMASTKAALDNGFAPDIAEYWTSAKTLIGNVSSDTGSLLADVRYLGVKVSGETGIQEYLSFVQADAGAIYGEDGKTIIGAMRKISAVKGMAYIRELWDTWGGYAWEQAGAGNSKIYDKLVQADKDIRSLMASSGAEASEIADQNWAKALFRYNVKDNTMTGDKLLEAWAWSSVNGWDGDKSHSVLDQLLTGEFLPPEVKDLFSAPSVKNMLYTMSGDPTVTSKVGGKEFQELLSGKGDDTRLMSALADTISATVRQITRGKNIDVETARRIFTENIMLHMTKNSEGAYDLIKKGVGDAKYHGNVGEAYAKEMATPGQTDIAGYPITSSRRYELQRSADAINTGVLALINKGTSAIDYNGFIGKDKNLYYFDPKGKYVYRSTPSKDGFSIEVLSLEEKTGAKTEMIGVTSDNVARMIGGDFDFSKLKRVGPVYRSTNYLKLLSDSLKTPEQLRKIEYIDSARAYSELYGVDLNGGK